MIHTTVHVRPPLPRPRPHPAPASTPTKVEATSRKEKSSSGGTTNMNPMRPLALHDRRPWFLSLYGAENSSHRMHVGGGDGDVHSHQGHGYGDAEWMSGLILQLGIMVHSFVVGLTLAIISGSEFGTCLLCHLLVQCYGPRSPPCVLSTSPPDAVAFHQFLKASHSVFLHRISPSPFRCGPEIIRHTTLSYNSSHLPRLHSSFHKKDT
ncbi:hypothetical protein V8B97DRAFT_1039397 [Scleroderma yunnanense]